MPTPSTSPLTATDLFDGDPVIVWEPDAYTMPERYLINGHVATEEAAALLQGWPGRRERRIVTGLKPAWATFTKHDPDACYIPVVEAEEGTDLSKDSHTCTCAAYDSVGQRWPAIAREAAAAAPGALAVTWVEAELTL